MKEIKFVLTETEDGHKVEGGIYVDGDRLKLKEVLMFIESMNVMSKNLTDTLMYETLKSIDGGQFAGVSEHEIIIGDSIGVYQCDSQGELKESAVISPSKKKDII